MDGATIHREFVAFMATAVAVFPTIYDQTWGPPLTAFMVYLGRREGHHVRCGDLGGKVEANHRTRGGADRTVDQIAGARASYVRIRHPDYPNN